MKWIRFKTKSGIETLVNMNSCVSFRLSGETIFFGDKFDYVTGVSFKVDPDMQTDDKEELMQKIRSFLIHPDRKLFDLDYEVKRLLLKKRMSLYPKKKVHNE